MKDPLIRKQFFVDHDPKRGEILKCLLIEDNIIDARLIEGMLTNSPDQSFQINLSKGNSLSQGIEKITQEDFDVILLDLDLPDSSGLESVQKFMNVTTAIPVVVITSTDDEKIAIAAVRCGVQDFLVKGKFAEADLRRTIEYSIERKRAQGRIENFQHFAEVAGYGFVLLDVNGRIVYTNDAFMKMMREISVNEMIGRMFFSYLPADGVQKMMEEILPLVRKNGQWFGEVSLLSRKQNPVYAIEDIMAVNDRYGNPLYFGAVIIDISQMKDAADQLAVSEKKHRDLFEKLAVGMAIHRGISDEKGELVDLEFLDVNPAFAQLTGFKKKQIVGHTMSRIMPEMLTEQLEICKQVALCGKTLRFEQYWGTFDRWFAVLAYTPQEGQFIMIMTDITDKKRMEIILMESEKRYRDLFQKTSEGIVVTDFHGKILDANKSYIEMLGYEHFGEIRGRSTLDFTPVKWHELQQKKFWNKQQFKKRYSNTFEKEYTRKDGRIVPVEIRGYMVMGDEQSEPKIWCFVRDLSDKKELDDRYQHALFYDQLTLLPNRLLALDRCAQIIARAQREQANVAFLLIDLDQFKIINETMGHYFGDQLLIEVAERLKHVIRGSDTVARLGGDEYLIILTDIESVEHAAVVAQKVLDAFEEPFKLKDKDVFVTASIGITLYPYDGAEVETLLKNADTAMYKSKDISRNNFAFFSPEMNQKATQRFNMEGRLRKAIESNRLILHYQPIYDIRAKKLIGAEALLRWDDPDLGFVMPDQFIPFAEETGLIIPIGDWVLERAIKQGQMWSQWYECPFRMAVNVSARQFDRKDLPEMIARILSDSGFSPKQLELEITERLLLDDRPHIKKILNQLSEMGVALSVDDFGTGYSALAYLKQFRFNVVKIDRSFIRDIPHDPQDLELTSAIIAMAHGLNLRIVAEGVETEEQLEILKFKGCDLAQGFFFSKAIPPEEFEKNIQFLY